jgi:hypothetical protein
MDESQAGGVQEGPLKARDGLQVARDAPSCAAVQRVADDGVTDRTQVHANLVRAAGCDGHTGERDSSQMLR